MFPEVTVSNVVIKVDCGYTCPEELNTMLVIATNIIVIPSILSFNNTWGIRLNEGKAYQNIFAHG